MLSSLSDLLFGLCCFLGRLLIRLYFFVNHVRRLVVRRFSSPSQRNQGACELFYRAASNALPPEITEHSALDLLTDQETKKALLLDMDETLIHSTARLTPGRRSDFEVEVYMQDISCVFHVLKRPYVDEFLQEVCGE